MVTIRHVDRRRSAFTHPGLKAIVAATRTCGQLCPNRQTPQKWDNWTPTGCFPRAIRRALVRRFRWRAPIISAAEKPAILLTTVFSRSSGENSRNRTDRMPSRAIGKRAGATEWAAHRPSRKHATFKLGSNVAPICFRERTHKCAGRPPESPFALKATVSDSGATCRDAPQGDIPYNQSSSGSSG